MNTAIENLVKQTLAVVLAAVITAVIASSISKLADTDITGKSFTSYVNYELAGSSSGTAAG
jgi:hypothetical protein